MVVPNLLKEMIITPKQYIHPVKSKTDTSSPVEVKQITTKVIRSATTEVEIQMEELDNGREESNVNYRSDVVVEEDSRCENLNMIVLQENDSNLCRMEREEIAKNRKKNDQDFDRKASLRKLDIGDRVKVWMPLKQNKRMFKWTGPFEVVDKIGELNYKMKLDDGRVKTYHIT